MKTRGRAYRWEQQRREWFVPASSLQLSGPEIGRVEGVSFYVGVPQRKWPNLKRMNRARGRKQPTVKTYYITERVKS